MALGLLLSGGAILAKPGRHVYTPAEVAKSLEQIQSTGMAPFLRPPDPAMQALSDALERGENLPVSPETKQAVEAWREEKRLERVLAGLPWKKGPVDIPLADLAHASVPSGFEFLDWEGMKLLYAAMGKGTPGEGGADRPLGMLQSEDGANVGILRVLQCGHIDDGGKLDADQLLAAFNGNRGGLAKALRDAEHPEQRLVGAGTAIQWTLAPTVDRSRHSLAWGRNGDPDLEEQDEFDFVLLGKDTAIQLQVLGPALGDTSVSPFGCLKPLLDGISYNPGSAYADRHGFKASATLADLVRGPKTDLEAQSEQLGQAIAAQAQGPSFWEFLGRHGGKLASLAGMGLLVATRLRRSRKAPEPPQS